MTGLGTAVLWLSAAPPAHGWSTESTVRAGCHETIIFRALDGSGWPDGATPPAMSDEDRRVANDVPFKLPDTHRNIWDVTLVLANREVDLGGNDPDDFPELSHWHARADLQALHCLRAPAQNGAEGDAQALADCRALILHEIELAFPDGDTPDLDAREENTVYLAFRGSAELSLPRYAYHLGRALHALQDGFSHTFRDPDDLTQVRSVLNYADFVGNNDFDPARDGFEHLSYLDACEDVDDLQQRRLDAAVAASSDLMNALADGAGGRAGRLARAEDVVLQYLSLDPDAGEMECVEANQWCDAPEIELSKQWTAPGACAVGGGGGVGAAAGGAIALALAVLIARRRRGWLVGAAIVGLVSAAPSAYAQEEEQKEKAAEQAEVQHERIDAQAEARGAPEGKPIERGFGLYLMGRGAVQDAGIAAALGVRYDLSEKLTLGIDAEFNPWVNLTSGGGFSSPGVFNGYATGIYHWDVVRKIELRTTLHLGLSYMLDDLAGAPRGSIGPFVGFAPIGVAIRSGKHVRLVIDPGVMVPIPSLKGTPLVRQQYGVVVGLQWNP